MTEDHRRNHYDEKLDHNRNISTSVVRRSCVEVIIPKKNHIKLIQSKDASLKCYFLMVQCLQQMLIGE